MLPLHFADSNLLYDVSCVAIPFDNADEEQIAAALNPADGALYGLFGPIRPDFRHFDLLSDVQWVFHANTPGTANLVPVRHYCGGLMVKNHSMIRYHVCRLSKVAPPSPLMAMNVVGDGREFSLPLPLASTCSCRRCR